MGRRPSFRTQERRPDEAIAHDGRMPHELSIVQLPAVQWTALRLHVRGWYAVAIAREVGRDRHTISRWLRAMDPRVREYALRESIAEVIERERSG